MESQQDDTLGRQADAEGTPASLVAGRGQRLRADGFEVNPPERSHAYTFYVKAPGGFTVEVMH